MTFEDASNFLILPCITIPPRDVVRKKFADALAMKKAFATGLADAEHKCREWESTLRHFFGEAEVQKVTQTYTVVDDDEAGTVKGKYIAAVAGVSMRDFCLFQQEQAAAQ
ncbi:hypothetical protein J3R83DRAFT_5536 [Lanmaoa asiatica]|nr:hypothetical protein J3R83DRAFT_5536 [Lanmaoa asiatica]